MSDNLKHHASNFKQLRILILSWRGPGHPNAGGAEASTHEHAKYWVKKGHEVILFTSRHKGSKSQEVIDGVNIVRRGHEEFGVKFAALLWYLFGKHEKFDIVVDQFHGIPFFTPLYVRTTKLAFIHEVAKEVWWLYWPWPRPFNLLPAVIGRIGEPWIFKLLYRNIPFMTVSESTKQDLLAWGIPARNVTVIHNGVTIPSIIHHPSSIIHRKPKVAMYLGALSRDKGIEDALEAFSILNKRDKGWRFWVVGKSDAKITSLVKDKIEELGLKGKVRIWGYVPEKKKFELLARALVLINPSIREGWGLVNIEANSMGTPVVAYDVSGSRDSVKNGDTGFLTEFGDVSKLASNILKLAQDEGLYEKLQAGALEWSKNFSWDKAGQKSLALLNEITKLES